MRSRQHDMLSSDHIPSHPIPSRLIPSHPVSSQPVPVTLAPCQMPKAKGPKRKRANKKQQKGRGRPVHAHLPLHARNLNPREGWRSLTSNLLPTPRHAMPIPYQPPAHVYPRTGVTRNPTNNSQQNKQTTRATVATTNDNNRKKKMHACNSNAWAKTGGGIGTGGGGQGGKGARGQRAKGKGVPRHITLTTWFRVTGRLSCGEVR